MKKLLKTVSCILASILLFSFNASAKVVTEYDSDTLTTPLEEAAETVAQVGTNLEINAESCILMEAKTGEILYENNSHERLAPASITKVMSLLLIMEAIDDGKLTTETSITASEHACSMGGSQIWLEPNETMTVHELLKAAVVGSANDATVALAEAVAGSEEGFVAMMNEKAEKLGLKETHFANATGLDAEGHITSAYDIAVMSKELIKHPLIKQYSTIWMDTLRNGESELVNTNKLVKFYEGCTGLKTGTTSQAGCCLSATAERDGMELIAVVMKAADTKERFNGARKLLDYGFANWSFITLSVNPEKLCSIPVRKGTKTSVMTETTGEKCILLQKGKNRDIVETIEYEPELVAEVSKGQCVGTARYTVDGKEVAVIKINAAEDVYRMTFLRSIMRMMQKCFTV